MSKQPSLIPSARRRDDLARRLAAVAVAGALALVATACGDGDSDTSTATSSAAGLAESSAGSDPEADESPDATEEPDGADAESDDTTDDDTTEDSDATDDGDDSAAGSGSGDGFVSPSEVLVPDPSAGVPDALEAAQSAGEIRNLVIDVYGPTDDVPAEINRLAQVTTDLPTPDGADIVEFGVVYTLARSEFQTDSTTVDILVHVPGGDLDGTFEEYRSALTDAGWPESGAGESSEEDSRQRYVTFTDPDEDTGFYGIDIAVIEQEDVPGVVVAHKIRALLDSDEVTTARAHIDALAPLRGDLPLLDGGEYAQATLRSFLSLFGFAPSLSFSETRELKGTGGSVAPEVLAAIEGSGWVVNEEFSPVDPGEAAQALADGDSISLVGQDDPDAQATVLLADYDEDDGAVTVTINRTSFSLGND